MNNSIKKLLRDSPHFDHPKHHQIYLPNTPKAHLVSHQKHPHSYLHNPDSRTNVPSSSHKQHPRKHPEYKRRRRHSSGDNHSNVTMSMRSRSRSVAGGLLAGILANIRFRIYYLFRVEPKMIKTIGRATQNERFLDEQLLERHRKEVRREQIRFASVLSFSALTIILFLVIVWFLIFTYIAGCDNITTRPVLTMNLENTTFPGYAQETLPDRILSSSLRAVFYRWKCPLYPTYYVEV